MDIFTTQLTKIIQTPIKPNRLIVKGLNKDAKTRMLDEEKDHILGETQSPDLHINNYDNKQEKAEQNHAEKPLTHEHDAEKNNDDDDENKPHIDIFI